ncbi:hypothetical protein TRFO_35235 [Tritrichomonas foetus]|uniref:Uncharacterized protein n=1 Tax=Tritrichomonas foetus TaxID=1144522 RepID=A0A1J4JM92_9EUKA|nr:hypothetical protein TRFO_35235 [Tritrichomonas foetus]|eukprot:OHS98388.1 hypothetical protein TRFO_35235 [Tritrichomonas foetus]
MISYKEFLHFPSQIKKFQAFTESFKDKCNTYNDEEYEHSTQYIFDNQESLVNQIFAAFENRNIELLKTSINYLSSYLADKMPETFPLLVDSDIIPVLISIASPENMLNCMNTAYRCLYNITCLYSNTTEIMLNNNILDIFYHHIFNMELMKSSICSIDGIINILTDYPQLIDQVSFQCRPSLILGKPPLKRLITNLLNVNKSLIFSFYRLFKFYLHANLPNFELEEIFEFFLTCINYKTKNCNFNHTNNHKSLYKLQQYAQVAGFYGINAFIMESKAKEEHFNRIASIDFFDKILLFDNDKDIIIGFEVIAKLVKYSLRLLNYDFRDIFEYCKRYFNSPVGVAAYELIGTILINCEEDTLCAFVLCSEHDFLEILTKGIIQGSFDILVPATKSLICVIKGYKENIKIFLNEPVFEALLKALLMDDKSIYLDLIETIRILFERCIINQCIDECISAFDCAGGLDAFDGLYQKEEDEMIKEKIAHFLNRFFPPADFYDGD